MLAIARNDKTLPTIETRGNDSLLMMENYGEKHFLLDGTFSRQYTKCNRTADISMFYRIQKHFLLTLWILSLFGASCIRSVAQQVVFENSKQYLGYYRPQVGEYGDEVTLAGSARLITDFTFQYTGKFTPQGDERAKVRFYANDGNVLSPYYTAPGTLLYESGYFPLNPGAGSRHMTGLKVVVPDRFTWTIEFLGLTMANSDQAGLLYFNPVTVGQSYGDYWLKTQNGSWVPYQTRGLDDNFAAKIVATYAPDSTPRITKITPSGRSKYRLLVNVIPGRNYALEFADPTDPKKWTRQSTILNATNSQIALIAPAPTPARLFRVTELARTVSMLGGHPLVSAKAIKGATYALEYKNSLSATNWTRLPDFMTASSDIVSISDLSNPPPPVRFYRIVDANKR